MTQLHSSIHMFVVLLLILAFSSSLDCYPPSRGSQLPIVAHCDHLVGALFYASRLPAHDGAVTWGRGLPSDAHTESLPKIYWLAGRGPQTCALNLDADPLHPDTRETFRLRAVAIAAGRVTELCLKNRAQLGRDNLGPRGQVVGKIVRTDSPIKLPIIRGAKGLDIPGIGELIEASRTDNGTFDDTE